MAFCVRVTSFGWRRYLLADIQIRLLEMQVFLCELVGKFSFIPPEDDAARPRYAATMMPALRDGKRGAPLCVRRMV
jgi:hypothetical protein